MWQDREMCSQDMCLMRNIGIRIYEVLSVIFFTFYYYIYPNSRYVLLFVRIWYVNDLFYFSSLASSFSFPTFLFLPFSFLLFVYPLLSSLFSTPSQTLYTYLPSSLSPRYLSLYLYSTIPRPPSLPLLNPPTSYPLTTSLLPFEISPSLYTPYEYPSPLYSPSLLSPQISLPPISLSSTLQSPTLHFSYTPPLYIPSLTLYSRTGQARTAEQRPSPCSC